MHTCWAQAGVALTYRSDTLDMVLHQDPWSFPRKPRDGLRSNLASSRKARPSPRSAPDSQNFKTPHPVQCLQCHATPSQLRGKTVSECVNGQSRHRRLLGALLLKRTWFGNKDRRVASSHLGAHGPNIEVESFRTDSHTHFDRDTCALVTVAWESATFWKGAWPAWTLR